jgi:cytosine/adenosine deaminase-related metal-dependent hydrolase
MPRLHAMKGAKEHPAARCGLDAAKGACATLGRRPRYRSMTFDPRHLGRRALMGAGLSATALLAATPAPAQQPAEQPAAQPSDSAKPGEYLITGAQLLTMDDKLGEIPNGAVHVRDGAIVAVGPNLDVPGAERIDAHGAVVMPGFVDTHWHLWATLARGLGTTGKGSFDKAMDAVAPKFRSVDNALGVRLSLAEAVHAGITTVCNFAHNIRSAEAGRAEWQAMRDSGVRGRFYYGHLSDLAKDKLMDLPALEALAKDSKGDGLVSLGVAARGPDRTVAEIWRREWAAARDLSLPISTHVAYSKAVAASGAIKAMEEGSFLGPDVQLIHLTQASDDDLRRVADGGSPVGLSPWTEMQVGFGLPPVARMQKQGLLMGLGLDNLALAGSADFFALMKLTADLAAAEAGEQGTLTERQVLEWATIGGARSMGLDKQIGSLTPGKRADLIMVRMDAINTAPATRPDITLVRAAQPANVALVMIDGRIHKRNGRAVGHDTRKLLRDAGTALTRLRQDAKI